MHEPVEYAEEATKAERARHVVVGLAVGAVSVTVGKLWLFPLFQEFANTAHCRVIFGFSGIDVLFFGVFVGVPLLPALLLLAAFAPRGYKTIRFSRFPPEGEKVFRPTRIRRGAKAKAIGYLHILAPLSLFLIAIWGIPQAKSIIAQTKSERLNCAPNPSIERTSSSKLRLLPAEGKGDGGN